MDRAVLDAYGWTDLQPTCEFLLDYEEEDEDDEPRRRPGRRRKEEALALPLARRGPRRGPRPPPGPQPGASPAGSPCRQGGRSQGQADHQETGTTKGQGQRRRSTLAQMTKTVSCQL